MRVSRLVTVVLVAALGAACSPSPGGDYTSRIASVRAEKDDMLRSASDSPVKPADRDRFLPLSYFPIDESYAVPAQLSEVRQRTYLQMPTSTGKIRQMEHVGTLEFTLHGEPMKLSAFVEAGTERISRLFVPFTDLTSGTETYAAGRYMDIDPTASGIYIVDFNLAYHPYCYYNADYDCPYPPQQNRLQTPVRAGERLPKVESSAP
ncbi:MAG: DUF1684 domain-containing protein [Vicinamibacterales bacterium]